MVCLASRKTQGLNYLGNSNTKSGSEVGMLSPKSMNRDHHLHIQQTRVFLFRESRKFAPRGQPLEKNGHPRQRIRRFLWETRGILAKVR